MIPIQKNSTADLAFHKPLSVPSTSIPGQVSGALHSLAGARSGLAVVPGPSQVAGDPPTLRQQLRGVFDPRGGVYLNTQRGAGPCGGIY